VVEFVAASVTVSLVLSGRLSYGLRANEEGLRWVMPTSLRSP